MNIIQRCQQLEPTLGMIKLCLIENHSKPLELPEHLRDNGWKG